MVDYDNIDYDNLRKVEGVEIIKSLIEENKHLKEKLEYFSTKTNSYTLSKNLIKVLVYIANTIKSSELNYFDVNSIYGINHKGSNTAFLTQLKYLGAITHYFEEEDLQKKSRQSGKWIITKEGYLFLNKKGKLPLKITIKNKEILTRENYCLITDDRIKWKTEDDIWTDLGNYE